MYFTKVRTIYVRLNKQYESTYIIQLNFNYFDSNQSI